MNVRKGLLNIPIPQPVAGIMGLSKFSRDVIRAIKALKNRQDSVTPGKRGGGRSLRPLQLVVSRPAYIPEPAAAVAVSLKRIFITWGTINNVIADNWDDEFDVSGIVTTYFFAKVTFSLSTDDLKVASWEILTDPASDAHETPEWTAGGVRPLYYVFSLGAMLVSSVVVETEGEPDETVYTHTLIPAPTSRMLTEHVSNIGGTGTAGEITLTKQISHYSV